MLTMPEKENLYDLIVAIIGEDATIKIYKHSFTENTVDIVEDMLSADSKCNANMKKRRLDLAKGSSLVAKGWLSKLLQLEKKDYKKIDPLGYACQISLKTAVKTAIINSAM